MNLAGMKRLFAVDPSIPMQIPPVGKVLYVWGAMGTDQAGGGKSWKSPLATIDYAIGLCTASKGDVILVHPMHTETVTSAITMDVIGVSIIGVKYGAQMPTITGNGTIDAVTMTAAGCRIENIRFEGPATDAQTADINIAAANCSVINTYHIGSITAKNKVSIITITAAGHDALIDGVTIFNAVVEVVSAIAVEGVAARVEICNCFIHDIVGFTSGALHVAAIAVEINVHDNHFTNAKAATAVVNFAANATGVIRRNTVSGRHTTIASNMVLGTSIDVFENRVCEEPLLNGMIMPAADAD